MATEQVKNLPAYVGDGRFDPWVEKIPERRAWQPTPLSVSGKSHEQRSLAGYMGLHVAHVGCKESDVTEAT